MDRSRMTNSFLGPMGAAFLYLEALNLQDMVAGLEVMEEGCYQDRAGVGVTLGQGTLLLLSLDSTHSLITLHQGQL